MNSIIRNLLLSLIMAGTFFGAGFHFGDKKATEKYLPEIAALKAGIDAADVMAKNDAKIYKENLDATTKHYKDRAARIAAYYDSLLSGQTATGNSGSGSETKNPPPLDAGSAKQTFSRCPLEIERRCVADAETIGEWQSIAIKNNWEIVDD
jgi:hypothetical protein